MHNTRKFCLRLTYIGALAFSLIACNQKEIDYEKEEKINSNYFLIPAIKLDIAADSLFDQVLKDAKNSTFEIKTLDNGDLAIETEIDPTSKNNSTSAPKLIEGRLFARTEAPLNPAGTEIPFPASTAANEPFKAIGNGSATTVAAKFPITQTKHNLLTSFNLKDGVLKLKVRLAEVGVFDNDVKIVLDLRSLVNTANPNLGKHELTLTAASRYTANISIPLKETSISLGTAVGGQKPVVYNTFKTDFTVLVKRSNSSSTLSKNAQLKMEIDFDEMVFNFIEGYFQSCTAGCETETTADDSYADLKVKHSQVLDGFGSIDGFDSFSFVSKNSYLAFDSKSYLTMAAKNTLRLNALDKDKKSVDGERTVEINLPAAANTKDGSQSLDTMRNITHIFNSKVKRIEIGSEFVIPQTQGSINPNKMVAFKTKAFVPLHVLDTEGSDFTEKIDLSLDDLTDKIAALMLHFTINNKLGMELSIAIRFQKKDKTYQTLYVSKTGEAAGDKELFITTKKIDQPDNFEDYSIEISEDILDEFTSSKDVQIKVKYRTPKEGVQLNKNMKFQIGISPAAKISDI